MVLHTHDLKRAWDVAKRQLIAAGSLTQLNASIIAVLLLLLLLLLLLRYLPVAQRLAGTFSLGNWRMGGIQEGFRLGGRACVGLTAMCCWLFE